MTVFKVDPKSLFLIAATSLINPCFMQRFFSRLSGIRAGRLISLSLRGPSPNALTLLEEVRFTDWRLRHYTLGECLRGLRYFGGCWERQNYGPGPGPIWKRPCAIFVRKVGRSTDTATPRCRGAHVSFPCIAPLYPWYVIHNAEYLARRYQVPYIYMCVCVCIIQIILSSI